MIFQDEAFEWEYTSLDSSQSSGAGLAVADPYPRSRSPDIFLADDDEDGWLGHLSDTSPARSRMPERALDSLLTNPRLELNSPEPDFALVDVDVSGSQPNAARLLELPEDALEATTSSHLPILMDDDHLYGTDGSSPAPLALFTVTAPRPSSGESSWAAGHGSPDGGRALFQA
ncbi:hypothetical protein OH77DRAFT_1423382 [Trametes cingulata]|nr:hypothetical protein OH77DRAFT_1423382 [Trametes cingulata]